MRRLQQGGRWLVLERVVNFVLTGAGQARCFVHEPINVALGVAHVELACKRQS